VDGVGLLIDGDDQSEEREDLPTAGAIDPTEVVRNALENAVKVAMATGLGFPERRPGALAPRVCPRARGDDGW